MTTKVETMVFRDNEPGSTVEYNAIMDPSFKDGYDADCSLAEFLSRPVRIGTFTWTEGTVLTGTVQPWHAYFNDARIKKKLDNYGLVHCNLKIKVLLNASPFYYGHGLVSYKPLPLFNGGNLDTVVGLTELVPKSQRPHIWIYPQESKGGEMTLPFFYHKNWLRVNSATDFQDMGMLYLDSDVTLQNANGVSGDAIEIQIYAWAENVTLAAPTTGLALQSVDSKPEHTTKSIETPLVGNVSDCDPLVNTPVYACHCDRCDYCICVWGIVYKFHRFWSRFRSLGQAVDFALQSKDKNAKQNTTKKPVSRSRGKGDVSYKSTKSAPKMSVDPNISGRSDEYGTGPVQMVSSAVSAATGALGDVPVIGPYMTATSFVAKTAANVAAFFGWSNPPVISNVTSFKDVPFHAMACPEISTPVEKLTLDPKNELCIDSRTVGLDGTDELNVTSIVSRESHLNYVTWSQTDVAGDLLYTYNVSPAFWRQAINSFALTPMAHISQIFEYWRGDIIFRFQIISSQYHRGRIRISWDPTNDILSDADTETVTFTRTYDIAEDKDFEIRIPYMQALPWLRTTALGAPRFGNPGIATDEARENGQLTVRVLNNLTAPDAASSVSIAVSVRGADNLSFASPRPQPRSYRTFEIQTSDVPKPDSSSTKDDEPNEVHTLGDPSDYVDTAYLINQGEAVKSLRPLLRRYQFSRSEQLPNDTTNQWRQTKFRTGRFPLSSGYDPNGIVNADSTSTPGINKRYNYVRNTTFNWLANCFIGMRGSMNMRVNVESQEHIDSIELERFNDTARNVTLPAVSGGARFSYVGLGVTPEISMRDDILQDLHVSSAGGCLLNQKTQTGLAAQLPMYSRFRMISTDPANYSIGAGYDETHLDSVELQVRVHPSATNDADTTKVNYYYGVGTDFTLFFYLNVPTIHSYGTPALP